MVEIVLEQLAAEILVTGGVIGGIAYGVYLIYRQSKSKFTKSKPEDYV